MYLNSYLHLSYYPLYMSLLCRYKTPPPNTAPLVSVPLIISICICEFIYTKTFIILHPYLYIVCIVSCPVLSCAQQSIDQSIVDYQHGLVFFTLSMIKNATVSTTLWARASSTNP